jgi:hypothetical protein
VIVVPESWAYKVTPHSAKIKADAEKSSDANERKKVDPPGLIHFPAMNLKFVLSIYSQLIGAKGVEAGGSSPDMTKVISLNTETPITKEEAIYAIDTILAPDDLKIVRATNDTVRLEKIQR